MACVLPSFNISVASLRLYSAPPSLFSPYLEASRLFDLDQGTAASSDRCLYLIGRSHDDT